MRGIYVLLIEIGESGDIQIGKRRKYHFEEGYYAYVGSALGNLDRRVARHLATQKRLFWHIDYLLNVAIAREVICAETNEKKECLVAQALSAKLASKAGFGCSDCNCSSHLFFGTDFDTLREAVLNSFSLLNLVTSEILYKKSQITYF
jgi:Uri superfamily endonuclease